MKQSLLLLVAWMVLLVPASVRAEPITIVDTGPGPSSLPGFGLGGLQWVAVEFGVTTPAVITTVQAWLLPSRSGFLDVSLYGGGRDVPGDLLFRSRGFINSGNADWQGVSGVSWTVTPGTYWVGLEGRGPGAMSGALPFPSQRPLRNGAIADLEADDQNYFESDGVAEIGLRIFDETTAAPVPEPSSMLLLGSGVAAALGLRRRRR